MLGAKMPPLPGVIPSSLPPPPPQADVTQAWGWLSCGAAAAQLGSILNPALWGGLGLCCPNIPPPPPWQCHPLLLGTVLAFSWWHLGVLVAGGLQVSWSEEEEEEGAGLGGGTELFPRALMSPSSILPAAAMGGVMQGDTG